MKSSNRYPATSTIRHLLGLLAWLLVAGLPVRAATLFSDDFNDGNANGWAPNNNAVFTWEGNAFHAQGSGSNYIYTSVHTAAWSNYSCQATVRRQGGTAGSFGGLVVRYRDSANYYFFAINDYQRYWFAKVSAGSIVPLVEWTAHSFITPEVNTLRVICQGNRFFFFVNGRFLSQCVDHTAPLADGSIGLLVQNDLHVSFDDVAVDSPATADTAILPWTDTFDDGNASGWVSHGSGGTFAVTGNAYVITGGGSDVLYQTYLDGPYQDFVYEAALTRQAGASTVPYGLTFRGQHDSYHSTYIFAIVGDQQYSFAKTVGGVWTNIQNWTLHSAITGSADVLKVKAQGTSFTLSINAQQVGVYQDATYAAGAVGLFVSNSIQAACDNVSLFDPHVSVVDPRRVGSVPGLVHLGPQPFGTTACLTLPMTTAPYSPALIYTTDGRCVRTIPVAADNTVRWDGTDARGIRLAPGVYVCRVAGQWIKLVKGE